MEIVDKDSGIRYRVESEAEMEVVLADIEDRRERRRVKVRHKPDIGEHPGDAPRFDNRVHRETGR